MIKLILIIIITTIYYYFVNSIKINLKLKILFINILIISFLITITNEAIILGDEIILFISLFYLFFIIFINVQQLISTEMLNKTKLLRIQFFELIEANIVNTEKVIKIYSHYNKLNNEIFAILLEILKLEFFFKNSSISCDIIDLPQKYVAVVLKKNLQEELNFLQNHYSNKINRFCNSTEFTIDNSIQID
jgi:hypothetical protein